MQNCRLAVCISIDKVIVPFGMMETCLPFYRMTCLVYCPWIWTSTSTSTVCLRVGKHSMSHTYIRVGPDIYGCLLWMSHHHSSSVICKKLVVLLWLCPPKVAILLDRRTVSPLPLLICTMQETSGIDVVVSMGLKILGTIKANCTELAGFLRTYCQSWSNKTKRSTKKTFWFFVLISKYFLEPEIFTGILIQTFLLYTLC